MASTGTSRSRSRSFGTTIQRASLAATVLLFVGGLAALAFTYGRMERNVATIVREPVKVAFVWPPLRGAVPGAVAAGQPSTWLSEPFRNQLIVVASTVLSDDVFDREALRHCGQAMLATGWFKSIRSIRRDGDGVVRIDGVWREPAAVVRHGERDYLVSGDGELLPVDYRPGASGLRVVVNPSAPPPLKPGDKWVGGDVQAALRLLAHLQVSAAYPQVAGIDAGMYVARKRLEILTDAGNRVVWGAAPGEFSPAEVPTEIKLGRLHFLINSADFGRRIDAGKPLVDIASPRDILIDVSAQPGSRITLPAGQAPPAPGAPHEAGPTIPAKAGHSLAARRRPG
ncbi:MAG: cell division protein FtsQ/DivIB [Phycisphaerales bacterium]